MNASWRGLLTGVNAFCSGAFTVSDAGVASVHVANTTQWLHCNAFHLCLDTVPPEAIADPAATIASAVALAKALNLSGFNIDDESHTAPRATVPTFDACGSAS